MQLEILDPKELSLDDIVKNPDELFYIYKIDNGSLKPQIILHPLDNGIIKDANNDYLIVRILTDDKEIELAPPVDKKRDKPTRSYEHRTYKFDGSDKEGLIFVEGKPTGDIRVNFKDKESAQLYMEYLRDFFYHNTTGADWLTVSTIYKELKLVNWNPDDCKDWGWATLDYGTCKYLSDVAKTTNKKMYGFTIKAPRKLYGITS